MKKSTDRLVPFFAIMFVFNMAAYFVHAVTPALIVDMQLNDYMFGLAMAAMMASNFLFSPFWGKIAGYISSKTVILISGAGYALGQVFFGIAQTEWQFLLAHIFAGIFVGGCYTAFLTYTVNMSSDEKRGRNLAVSATVNAVSCSFGYFVGGMIGEIDIYLAVWVQIAVLLATSVLMYLFCADDRKPGLPRFGMRGLLRECNPFGAILQCRHHMTLLLASLFLAYGLSGLGYIAFEQCFNFYLRDQFQLSSGYNGVIKAALGIISLISNSTLCLWILRRKRTMPWIAGVMGLCSAAMIGVIGFDGAVPFIAVNVVFFAFYFISVPLIQDRAAALSAGEHSNLLMGSFNAVKSFGSIFGSALAGFLYEIHPKTPFVFGFAAFAAATVIIALLARSEKRRAA